MARDDHRILLIGATGMVGEAVLATSRKPIYYLARRPADRGDRHHAIIAPIDRWVDEIAALKPTILLSALGTTMRQAGSQQAFRAIDHDLQIAAARAASEAGAEHFIGVSSVGASAASRNFYLRTKGEADAAIAAMPFARADFLRPGLLRGSRKGPQRLREGIAAMAAPLSDALMIGALRKYRSVAASSVAGAIGALVDEAQAGRFVHDSAAIAVLAD